MDPKQDYINYRLNKSKESFLDARLLAESPQYQCPNDKMLIGLLVMFVDRHL
jgi:hypothetical protein